MNTLPIPSTFKNPYEPRHSTTSPTQYDLALILASFCLIFLLSLGSGEDFFKNLIWRSWDSVERLHERMTGGGKGGQMEEWLGEGMGEWVGISVHGRIDRVRDRWLKGQVDHN